MGRVEKLGIGLLFAYISFVGLFLWGWILNIVKVFEGFDLESGKCILRIVGIFVAPLGAILGFL